MKFPNIKTRSSSQSFSSLPTIPLPSSAKPWPWPPIASLHPPLSARPYRAYYAPPSSSLPSPPMTRLSSPSRQASPLPPTSANLHRAPSTLPPRNSSDSSVRCPSCAAWRSPLIPFTRPSSSAGFATSTTVRKPLQWAWRRPSLAVML